MADTKFLIKQNLREAFIYYKSLECNKDLPEEQWDKRYIFSERQNNEKIWDKAAELCLKYKIPETEFVEIAYQNCKKQSKILLQFMLCGSAMEKLCEKYVEEQKDLVPQVNTTEYIDNCLKFVKQVINSKRESTDMSEIFLSKGYDFPGWVRVLMLKDIVSQEVINKYRNTVVEELRNIPDLEVELKKKGINILDVFKNRESNNG